MGLCSSAEATEVIMTTAKVVKENGGLQEYSDPVLAWQVLSKHSVANSCFLCDADEMEFGFPARAMSDDEELKTGQLYFLLPNSMLRRPLQNEDMAVLALRANAAMSLGGCRRKSVAPLVMPSVDVVTTALETKQARSRRSKSAGRGRDFESDLGAIPE